MDTVSICFNHVDIKKLSVSFTWDDNFFAHSRLIAPEFLKRGLRCSFYVNPGGELFEDKYLPLYRALSGIGFEIGSHGYRHDNYKNMPFDEFEREIEKSAFAISASIGVYPSTFAFPYHDFSDEMLRTVRKLHLETRNTLENSRRFGIKADSTLDEMIAFAEDCVFSGHSMVFSGHSAVPADPNAADKEDLGYGPVPIKVLSALLDRIQAFAGTEMLTFEQAALKKYIMDNCPVSEGSYTIKKKQLEWLKIYGIDARRLSLLI